MIARLIGQSKLAQRFEMHKPNLENFILRTYLPKFRDPTFFLEIILIHNMH